MNRIDKIFEDFTDTPCRACMFKCPITTMIDLFKEDKIGNIFTEFTSLQVTELDGLPSHLCQNCYQICTQFWEFKLKCITSDQVFKQKIAAIKQEQEEKADSFINTKWIDILVKTQTEAKIESPSSFNDSNECKDNLFDDDNKPSLNKNNNSRTKRKNETDSDWNNYSDDDNKKPKKKPNRKKLSKNNAKNDTSRENFFCDHCDKVFRKKHRIQAHLRTHLGLKEFACDQCNLSFRKWDSLVSHNKIKHVSKDELKVFICHYENCGRQYSMTETLRKHVNAYHLGRKCEKIICELCGKSCPSRFAAKVHNYTHTGKMPFACTICPKKCISNYQLKIHMNYHTKEKSYPCDKCSLVFTSPQNVSRHNKVVHLGSRPYLCTFCQRSFSKAVSLKNHIMTHTGEKPHACNLCDKRFIQLVALRTHMKVHDKPKISSRNEFFN